MTSSQTALLRVAGSGVIAVVRLTHKLPPAAAVSLSAGGISLLEITLTTPAALESIAECAAALPQCTMGAGTVLDVATARNAISAGARFIVSPVFDASVGTLCMEQDVLYVPGALTPTEMLHAWRAGATLIKVFPASQLGPGFFRDVLAPLPFLRLVPSGGVSLANAGDWIRAGAAAVSVGTSLINNATIRPENGTSLTVQARALVTAVATARKATEPSS